MALDTFSAGQLSVPQLSVGAAIFSDMVVTPGTIVRGPTGTSPVGSEDSYEPVTRQLSIPSVVVGANVYYNVIITVGSLVSAGSVTYNGTYLSIPSVQAQQQLHN
jgi:hypothetical protein